jgi:hypothetical protein
MTTAGAVLVRDGGRPANIDDIPSWIANTFVRIQL